MTMDEINQVRIWADRASRTYTELQNKLDVLHLEHAQLLRERNELVAERDEARRELCEFAVGWQRAGMRVQHPQQYAQERGWDCFKVDGK